MVLYYYNTATILALLVRTISVQNWNVSAIYRTLFTALSYSILTSQTQIKIKFCLLTFMTLNIFGSSLYILHNTLCSSQGSPLVWLSWLCMFRASPPFYSYLHRLICFTISSPVRHDPKHFFFHSRSQVNAISVEVQTLLKPGY